MADILIASEDVALLESLQSTLEAEGYSVVTASDGLEAYAACSADQTGLVILDAVLPVHSGLEASRMIREDPDSPNPLSIVLLSGHDIDPRRLEAAGVTQVLDRDVSSVELRELVSTLVSG